MNLDDVKKALMHRSAENPELPPSSFLRTGSTLLDLACSGRVQGGFIKGRYFLLVGDSSSGKTFLSLTCLAEASKNKAFDDYRFIYDNAEDGALMNLEFFFGEGVAKRTEPPKTGSEGEPIYSSTIEEFYFHVDDAVKAKKPFIYILDSMDALSSDYEGDKFDASKKAHEKDVAVAGSYGDGKAKSNSAGLRRIIPALVETGSILVVICQTRDNIGDTFQPKTRAGGHALKFYAAIEIWLSVGSKITKTYREIDRQIGVYSRIRVKKNRVTGRERTISVPIYYSYGIDDLGSCIDYLIQEKRWTLKGQKLTAPDFDFEGRRDTLIKKIEDEDLYKDLQDVVAATWEEVEEACSLKRKPRY